MSIGSVQETWGDSYDVQRHFAPLGCLVGKMGPRVQPEAPPAPTAPTGLCDLKRSHRRGRFSKMHKWKVAEGRGGKEFGLRSIFSSCIPHFTVSDEEDIVYFGALSFLLSLFYACVFCFALFLPSLKLMKFVKKHYSISRHISLLK